MHFYLILTLFTSTLRADNVQIVTNRSHYAYVAAVFVHDKYHTIGTIIGCRFVLVTATSTTVLTGNIVRPIDTEDMEVMAGSIFNLPTCPTRTYKISKIVVHEDFNLTAGLSDIALLKLASSFPKGLNNTIHPISIKQISAIPKLNTTKCSIPVWDRSTYQGHTNVPLLLAIDEVKVISNKNCKSQSWPDLHSDLFCADQPENVACYNLSGSLVMCGGNFPGIVSHSNYNNNCSSRIVVTQLELFKDWITKKIMTESKGYSCMKMTRNELKISLLLLFLIYIFQRICG